MILSVRLWREVRSHCLDRLPSQASKSSIINQVPLDTHKSAINVTDLETIRKIIKSRNEGNGSFQESSIVGKEATTKCS
jgi:hypothetical protein